MGILNFFRPESFIRMRMSNLTHFGKRQSAVTAKVNEVHKVLPFFSLYSVLIRAMVGDLNSISEWANMPTSEVLRPHQVQ